MKFSSYLTGNTLRLRYKDQPINAVQENNAVYCENHTKHTDTLCGQNAVQVSGTYGATGLKNLRDYRLLLLHLMKTRIEFLRYSDYCSA
jgi:hypothetical protein